MSSIAFAAVIGLLSGTHTAIWGMYKDSIHEGFDFARFTRSIVVGAVVASAIQYALRLALPNASAMLVVFGLAYAAERGLVEVWKTFVREEDQSKYTIPMQFSVRGIPVRSRHARWAAGAGYVAVVALSLAAIAQPSGEPTLVGSSLTGLAVGAIIAIGGAWKDHLT